MAISTRKLVRDIVVNEWRDVCRVSGAFLGRGSKRILLKVV